MRRGPKPKKPSARKQGQDQKDQNGRAPEKRRHPNSGRKPLSIAQDSDLPDLATAMALSLPVSKKKAAESVATLRESISPLCSRTDPATGLPYLFDPVIDDIRTANKAERDLKRARLRAKRLEDKMRGFRSRSRPKLDNAEYDMLIALTTAAGAAFEAEGQAEYFARMAESAGDPDTKAELEERARTFGKTGAAARSLFEDWHRCISAKKAGCSSI